MSTAPSRALRGLPRKPDEPARPSLVRMNIRDTITAVYDVLGKAESICRIIQRETDLANPAIQKMLREEAERLKAALDKARQGLNGGDDD